MAPYSYSYLLTEQLFVNNYVWQFCGIPYNTTIQYKQEFSYCKQIARQRRTQYAEGIYSHKYYTVTLKSKLRVTQCHWKRNHWIDHTRVI